MLHTVLLVKGYSALHLAARCGRLNVVKILLSTSDVDAETDEVYQHMLYAKSRKSWLRLP